MLVMLSPTYYADFSAGMSYAPLSITSLTKETPVERENESWDQLEFEL